jgi:hypothetical protein
VYFLEEFPGLGQHPGLLVKQILARQANEVKASPFGISRHFCFFSEVGWPNVLNLFLCKGKISSITRESNSALLGLQSATTTTAQTSKHRHHRNSVKLYRSYVNISLQSFDIFRIIPKHLRNFACWESLIEIHSFGRK